MVTVRRVDHENLLRKESWECDCEFAKIMKFPCRHAMMYKKSIGSPFVIPYAAIASRWYDQSRLSTQDLSEVAKPFVAKIFEQPTASAVMQTEQQKYRRAQQAFSRISGEVSQFSDDAFDSAMSQFGEWWHNLRQGQTVIPPPHSSGGRGHHDHSKEGGSTGGDAGVNDDSDEVPPSQQAGVQTLLQTLPEHAPIYVTFNGRVVPVGRPRPNRKKMRAKAKSNLKEYNQGMNLRGMLRERDVCEVAAALKEIDPCLREASSFLATFQVLGKTTGKHLIWCLDTEFVSDNVWYRLPEPTIDRALEFLRERLPGEQAEIHLDSDGEIGDSDGYMVAIETIGTYTREQLKSMKWLWNLQATCRRGVALCTWFNTEVKRLVNEPGPVAGAFDKILNAWPDKTISSFGFDITMSDIFCMRGSTWLNDDAMCASSVLLQHYNNNSTVTMPPLKQQSRKIPAKLQPLLPEKKLLEICAGVAVCPFVLVPINFDGAHWGCLVIDGRSKMIQLHDSMNSNKNVMRLKAITTEIGSALQDTYEVIQVDEPLQKDGDSCGVLVCLHM
ncbi:hypothetical protein PC114_g10594 [Phytophthora cactorum]|nr:hypothetical protein PC114_g10594 [Phytophthora cactorum]